jgi:putative heme-binding domain-containing protein
VISLMAFLEPQPLDRIQGFSRSLPARDRALVIAAATPVLEGLIFGKSKSVQAASAQLIAALGLPEWRERLQDLALDDSREPAMRVTAFTALEAMAAPGLDKAVATALTDKQAPVRAIALAIQMRSKPNDDATYNAIKTALASTTVSDRQFAIQVLGSSKHKRAVAMLTELLEQWQGNTLDNAVWLDVAEAVRAQGDKNLMKQLTTLEKSLAKKAPLGLHAMAMVGGDVKEGEQTYRTNSIASCMQCHLIGSGGLVTVGPNLTGVGTRLTPEKIVLSLIDPGAEIADGFGVVNVTLKDGTVFSGALASETDKEIHLRPIGGAPQPIMKDKIASQSKPVSIMPPMAANLAPRELRDLVAYLSSLK